MLHALSILSTKEYFIVPHLMLQSALLNTFLATPQEIRPYLPSILNLLAYYMEYVRLVDERLLYACQFLTCSHWICPTHLISKYPPVISRPYTIQNKITKPFSQICDSLPKVIFFFYGIKFRLYQKKKATRKITQNTFYMCYITNILNHHSLKT